MDHRGGQLVRDIGDPVAVEAHQLRRLLHRPRHQAAVHDRSDRVQPELELGDDAEVPAATADAPEQVRVHVLARGHQLALGGDHVDRDQVVDLSPYLRISQPIPPPRVSPASPVCVTIPDGSPGRTPASRGQVRPAAHPPAPGRYAVPDRPGCPSAREIDHDSAVAGRVAGEAVAAAADRDRQPVRRAHAQRASGYRPLRCSGRSAPADGRSTRSRPARCSSYDGSPGRISSPRKFSSSA